MDNKEQNRFHAPIIAQLKIGNKYPWPIFQIDINSLTKKQPELLCFFGNILNTTNIKTVERNLLQAEKILLQTNKPVEITQYKTFKFFEEATNQMYSNFRNLPGNKEVNELIETNTHHGYVHQRRLEKHLKEFFKKEPEYRRNPDLLFFTLSQLISIRFHDVLELFPDGKEFHTEGGALLILGYLNQNRETFNQILEEMGMDKPNNSTWSKIIASTFITCLYHSKPKLLKEVQNNIATKSKININGFLIKEFNLSDLFTNILFGLQQKHENKPNLISFINKGLSFLKKNKDKTIFTHEETENLIESIKIFAAIDKLDSILPAELSTARTFITMKDNSRPFLMPLEEIVFENTGAINKKILCSPFCQSAVKKIKNRKSLNYLDEYYLRIALGESSSPDDFSRLLFETQRVDFPDDLPNWLKAGFKFALEEKGNFLLEMVPEFLISGNIKLFHQVYLQAEAELLAEFLSKYGYHSKEEIDTNISFYLKLETEKDKFTFISNILEKLEQIDAKPHNIFVSINTLRQEQRQLEETLTAKKIKLNEANLTGKITGEKAKKLLEITIKMRQLPKVNTKEFSSSYTSYYSHRSRN